MQPYFFPYIGYFQLIHSVDEFIIYDNIKYTKKGWINRNRILASGSDRLISLPLKKGPDHCDVVQRELAASWNVDRQKMLNMIKASYINAPYFKGTFGLIERCIKSDETNLFKFLFNSITEVTSYLGIGTCIIKSSDIEIDHALKSEEKVLALCEKRCAQSYLNSMGGVHLYDKARFKQRQIDLAFLESYGIRYQQFSQDFIPCLSIIDVLMFNSLETTQDLLHLKKIHL